MIYGSTYFMNRSHVSTFRVQGLLIYDEIEWLYTLYMQIHTQTTSTSPKLYTCPA